MPFGDPYPYWPPRETTARPTYVPDSITVHPNVLEQMGVDPISKLAAAIEKLADALKDCAEQVPDG